MRMWRLRSALFVMGTAVLLVVVMGLSDVRTFKTFKVGGRGRRGTAAMKARGGLGCVVGCNARRTPTRPVPPSSRHRADPHSTSPAPPYQASSVPPGAGTPQRDRSFPSYPLTASRSRPPSASFVAYNDDSRQGGRTAYTIHLRVNLTELNPAYPDFGISRISEYRNRPIPCRSFSPINCSKRTSLRARDPLNSPHALQGSIPLPSSSPPDNRDAISHGSAGPDRSIHALAVIAIASNASATSLPAGSRPKLRIQHDPRTA